MNKCLYKIYSRFICLCMFTIGKTVPNDILAVHCKDELVGYAGVLVGYGYLGDVIHASQTNRWTGSFRYTSTLVVFHEIDISITDISTNVRKI